MVLECMRIGPKSGLVGRGCAVELTEARAGQSQRMPCLSVPCVATQGFHQARLGEFRLTPARGAQTRREWAQRITRRDLRRVVVLFERIVVAVTELQRVAELDPRHGAGRAEHPGQCLGLCLRAPHLPHTGMYSQQQAALGDRFGVLQQISLELLGSLCGAPLLH